MCLGNDDTLCDTGHFFSDSPKELFFPSSRFISTDCDFSQTHAVVIRTCIVCVCLLIPLISKHLLLPLLEVTSYRISFRISTWNLFSYVVVSVSHGLNVPQIVHYTIPGIRSPQSPRALRPIHQCRHSIVHTPALC